MSEIYIFDRDDNLLSPITQSTGLISTWFKDHLNRVADEPFVFTVQADTEESRFVKAENQVAFRDKDGDYRLFVIKEIDDDDGPDGPQTIATCFPAFMVELKKRFIVDRRFVEQVAQKALDATLEGTRWKGIVSVDLGTATTNFYHMLSVDAIWKILEVWGGDFKDIVRFNGNKIVSREIHIVQRLGTDNGHRFEIDHNVEEIARTVISNPVTALYGYGASLEIEDENGEATGGFTRFISFADVEWKVSNGDPVDKPKGQPWVGDPEALQRYGLLHEGRRLHLEDEFSNQEYEDPAELLQATWEHLQKVKDPEINYRLSVWLLERLPGYEHEKVSLGDTSRAIDRRFSRPIEIQARIIGLEYDIMDIERTAIAEMGQFLSVHDYDDRLDRAIETIRDIQGDLKTDKKVNEGSFPDIKPSVPANVQVDGAFQSIQLYWEFNAELYVKNYEVYGSQVKGFVPDAQHLLHRGTLNGFNHVVETDQVWYYRIRAVNYQGRASDYTAEYSGSTVRVMSEDILFGPELAAELRELSKVADILAPGSIDLEKMKQEALDKINESSREYSQEEIQKVADEINQELADKAGLDYVNGELRLKVDATKYKTDIEDIQDTMGAIQVQVDEDVERLTSVSDSLLTKVNANKEALSTSQGRIIAVEQNMDTISGNLSTAVRTLTALDNTVSEQTTLIEQQADRIRFLASQDSVDQLTGRITTAETSLSVLDGRISSKAEASSVFTKTEMNTALGKKIDSTVYNNKMSQLDVAFSGIQANVKSIESDVSSVGSRLITAESQLDIQAGLIEAKAEKNQVYTKTDADGRLSTEISKAKSDIKVTTDGISQTVSNVNAKIDGLEVGGRNLVPNSSAEKLYSNGKPIGWGLMNGARDFFADDGRLNGKSIKVTVTGNGQATTTPKTNLATPGKEYTISFWAKMSASGRIGHLLKFKYKNGSEGNPVSSVYEVVNANEWVFVKQTFTVPADVEYIWTSPRVDNIPSGVTNYLWVDELKLESGNKATDWTPAFEDIDDNFTEVNSSMSSIDQKANSIQLSVNSLTQTVNGHTSSISSMNTSITQMDGKITSKAESSEVKAVNDRVTSANSKVSTLEVSVNGISTSVTQLDSKVENIEVGGRNLVIGTSNTFETATFNGWDYYFGNNVMNWKKGMNLTGRIYLKPKNYEASIMIHVRFTDGGYSQFRGNIISAGSEGYSVVHMQVPDRDDIRLLQYSIRHSSGSTPTNIVDYKEAKIEKGTKASDWTLSPEDIDDQISKANTRIDQNATAIGFKASQQSVNDLTGRMTKAESSLTVQSKQIEAKVDSNGVIAAINLQPGTIKIKASLIDLVGDVYITNGRTYISTAAVGTLAVADGAITRAKLVTAIIGEAQIENGVITNAKIKDVSADKIKFGTATGITLTAVTINGSQFRSSDGSTSLDITGGHVRLRQSNGNYVHTNPDGLYGYNSNSSLRFQADSLLVTSRALGTTTANVYIAAQSGKEARVVDMKDVPSDGEVSSYSYIPVRAQGFYGNYIEVNAGENGFNLYLRPRNGGEVRVTGANTTDVYYPLRAATIYASSFVTTTTSAWIGTDSYLHIVAKGSAEGTLNPIYRSLIAYDIYGRAFVTTSTHAYMGTDDELRVQNKSLSGIWRNVRANAYYGNAMDINTGTHLYIRPSSSGEVRITQTGTTGTYMNFRAQNIYAQGSVSETSLAERKQDIEEMQGSALDLVMNSTIYQYRLKEDVKTGQGKMKFGFVIGEGYKTPTQVLAPDLASISLYSQGSINWKATKELGLKQYQHELKLNDLSLKAQYQDLIIEKQGEQISKMQDEINYLKDAVA